MRASDTLALVVIGYPVFAPPVHVDIGGVQVDRHRGTQPELPRQRQVFQHPLGCPGHPGLHGPPLWTSESACQTSSGGRGQTAHWGDLLPRDVGTLPVQAGQEVLPGQLRRRQADQQLTGSEPAITLLDRPHRRVQRLDHTQPIHQLGHRGHPRHRGQARIRRADTHLPPTTAPTT